MYLVEKKNTRVDCLQYKIIITKETKPNTFKHLFIYGHCDGISKYSFSIIHKVVVKNDGCITSHNKCGEQAFYTNYTGK